VRLKTTNVTHPFMFHYIFSAVWADSVAAFGTVGNKRVQIVTIGNKREQIVTVGNSL